MSGTAPPERPDLRLEARYRRLLLAIALPLFTAVVLLVASQHRDQRGQVLHDLAQNGAAYRVTLEGIAKLASDHVHQMRIWSEAYLASPPGHLSPLRPRFRPRTTKGEADGYTLDELPEAERVRVGQVPWLAGDPRFPEVGAKCLDLGLDFFGLARLTHEVTPHFRWSYFFPAGADFIAIYPWVHSHDLVEGMGHRTLREGIASWFADEIFLAGTPERNPGRTPYWTAPYLDAGGAGPMVSHGAPVYLGDRFEGIVGTDLKLATLERLLEGLPRELGRLLILDGEGRVLADTGGSAADGSRRGEELLPGVLTPAALRAAVAARGGFSPAGRYALSAHRLEQAPWTLAYLASEREIARLLLPRLAPYGIILAVLGLTFLVSLYLLRREFIRPALELVHYIHRVSGDLEASPPRLPRLWQSWVDLVARTFAEGWEASLRLKASESFKSAIVENALLAIVTMDEAGRVVEFNPAAEALFGHRRQDALGADLADLLIPQGEREAHRKGLARYLRTGVSRMLGSRLELKALRADGSELPVELSVSATRVGDARYFTAFIADLTELKRAEEQLARQRDALLHSEKLSAMGALLAGVAHELNNPLAILMGRAALLEQKTQDGAIQSDVRKIHDAAERCGRIVRTFLAMARQSPGEQTPTALNDVVTAALDLLGYGLRSAGIVVETNLAPDLPRGEMDGDQIGQVVVNLIVNAQQALEDAPPPRRVRVQTFLERGSLCLRVEDNGPGVPRALWDRIFDPFFTTKTEGAGAGVGLSVCRAILREHGGTLALEARASGASFLARLPLNPAAGPEASSAAAPLVDPRVGHALIVDDEPEVAALLGDILESAGFRTTRLGNGHEALRWLDDHGCDLVLSDIRMPDMDGPALWRTLKERHPALARRIAFITGDTLSAGAVAFLQETGLPGLEKPFTPEDVLSLVARIEAA